MLLDGLVLGAWVFAVAWASLYEGQKVFNGTKPQQPISNSLFSSLERTARLVDITYCVGTTGVSKPFSCISRCNEFPSLNLITTWHTGVLMSDSCGYIAIDHGIRRPDAPDGGHVGKPAVIVAFRGTYSISSTIVDLSTIPQEYAPYPSPGNGGDDDEEASEPQHKCDNCTVHMGFLASWRSARATVLPALEKLRKDHADYPIWLVGHSLGGAVAALAALELRVGRGLDNILITTFGEPRIGNQGLADYLDNVFGLRDDEDGSSEQAEAKAYRRVTHTDDPVPLLPLSEWGYRSHAGEIFISKPDLAPGPEDVVYCVGDNDERCIEGSDGEDGGKKASWWSRVNRIPARLKLWQILFAHRDYFWRLGLCVPGGDPRNWELNRSLQEEL